MNREYTYIWTVITNTENGKHYSHAWRFGNGSTLSSQMEAFKGASIHLCKTKKEAYELAGFWNNCYKDNGTYMFDGEF